MAGSIGPISLPNYAGVDFNQILQSIEAAGQVPIDQLQQEVSTENSAVTALGQIGSDLSTLESALTQFQTMGAQTPMAATVSSGAPLTATVDSTGGAQAGSYSVSVSQLAQAQVSVSQGYSSASDAVGTGTVTLTVGATNYTVTLTSSNDTLQGLADAVNSSGAPLTAQVLDTGSGSTPYVLELSAAATGTNDAFSVSSSLSGGTAPTFTTTVAAQNAALTVNGVAFASQSNTVTDAIAGVTLGLSGAGGPYTVTVAQDTASESQAISAFVSAYNKLLTDVASNTQTQPGQTPPPLASNGAVESIGLGLQIGLDGINLSDLGITVDNNATTNNNGQLVFDQTSFLNAVSTDPSGVQQAFPQVYNALYPMVSSAQTPTTGLIPSETTSFNNLINQQDQQIGTLTSQLQQQEQMFISESGQVQAEMAYYANIAQLFLTSSTTGSGSGLSSGTLASVA